MRNLVFLALVLSVLSPGAFAQKGRHRLKEPACCRGKKCFHASGEHRHHVCNKFCHSKRQRKGQCCAPRKR